MSNQHLVDESVVATLTRLSPTKPGFDRDQLLFEAGRASARTPVGWKIAVVALAVSQLLMLGYFLRPDLVQETAVPPQPAADPLPALPTEQPIPEPIDPKPETPSATPTEDGPNYPAESLPPNSIARLMQQWRNGEPTPPTTTQNAPVGIPNRVWSVQSSREIIRFYILH